MTRTLTSPGNQDAPRLDTDAVAAFFDMRARRIDDVGPVRAVIYQDKQTDLAERRDLAETQRLMPLLALNPDNRLLDVGCGTGRWTGRIAPHVAHYHGIDFSPGLLEHARQAHEHWSNCHFTQLGADAISPPALGQTHFDRIFCAGVCIYLNDDQLLRMFAGIESVAASCCRMLLREPMGLSERLTLNHHYSDDLEHEYHAIYRTQAELQQAMQEALMNKGFALIDQGDVYAASLNNRSETRQRWLLLERRA